MQLERGRPARSRRTTAGSGGPPVVFGSPFSDPAINRQGAPSPYADGLSGRDARAPTA